MAEERTQIPQEVPTTPYRDPTVAYRAPEEEAPLPRMSAGASLEMMMASANALTDR